MTLQRNAESDQEQLLMLQSGKVYVIGDTKTFNDLVYQVKRISGNINQLRLLAQLGKIDLINLDECTDELDEIRRALNRIIRKADKWQQ